MARNLLIGIFLTVILLLPIGQYAFADRFSEWIEIWKKQEEHRAIQYQIDVLHFDYSKIHNDDPGFKEPVTTKVAEKKHIQNERTFNFIVIKNLNND